MKKTTFLIVGKHAVLEALKNPSRKIERVFLTEDAQKKINRETILLEISKNEKTTIIYESPQRLRKLLKELLDSCGGNREIMVARELTKKFEEHVGNNINEVIEFFKDKDIIGEITSVVKGIKERDINYYKFIIKKDLDDLIKAGLSLSAASKYLAKKNGLKKGEIYNMSNIDFNTNSIQNVGFSPEAIGVAFSLEEGEMTRPIKIDDGIIVLSLNSISQADSLNSYSDYGISLLQANKFTSSLKVDNAVKEFSNINKNDIVKA